LRSNRAVSGSRPIVTTPASRVSLGGVHSRARARLGPRRPGQSPPFAIGPPNLPDGQDKVSQARPPAGGARCERAGGQPSAVEVPYGRTLSATAETPGRSIAAGPPCKRRGASVPLHPTGGRWRSAWLQRPLSDRAVPR
jgi:hypothetical protein